MPENYEEARALIPTLAKTPQETVQKIINFLAEKKGIARQWSLYPDFD